LLLPLRVLLGAAAAAVLAPCVHSRCHQPHDSADISNGDAKHPSLTSMHTIRSYSMCLHPRMLWIATGPLCPASNLVALYKAADMQWRLKVSLRGPNVSIGFGAEPYWLRRVKCCSPVQQQSEPAWCSQPCSDASAGAAPLEVCSSAALKKGRHYLLPCRHRTSAAARAA
jgi:hypothetical protein